MNEKKSHISGIYNYCDRWCERCNFTSKCLLFTNESKITTHQILNNGELPDFDKVFNFTDESEENSDSEFNEQDDDFFEFDDDEENEDPFYNDLPDFEDNQYAEDRKQRDETVKNNTLAKLGDEYFNSAQSLLKKINGKYELYSRAKEKVDNKFILQVYEGFEVLEWFHMFIFVKIKRALSGKWSYDKESDEELKEIDVYDMNGTAKIALIAVENSIQSLNKLFNNLEEFKKEIEALLVTAGRLLNEMEKVFPDCRSFVRPGLDE